MRIRGIYVLLLLAACSVPPEPSPTVIPLPTVSLISVFYPVELGFMLPELQACRAQIPDSGLLVYESLVPPLPDSVDAFTLWLGEPPEGTGYAADLGTESIGLYVNAENRVPIFDEAGIRMIFGGIQETWGETGWPVAIWFPLDGTASARTFQRTVGSFRITPTAFLAPSPSIAAEQVAREPGGITVMPAGWETPDLRLAYKLSELPVTALAIGEPAGMLREYIFCLQKAQLFNSP